MKSLFSRKSREELPLPTASTAASFPAPAPAPPPVQASSQSEPAPAKVEEEEEPKDDSMAMAFRSELDDESGRLGDAVQEAHMKKRELENEIASGDRTLADAKRDMDSKLGMQAKATDQVKLHQTGLDDLMKTLEREAAAARSKAGEQSTGAKRLKEEHLASVATTAAARVKCKDARRLLAESIAAGKADILKADENVCNVEAAAAKATEALASTRAAAQALSDRIGGLVTKATVAEREQEFHDEAAANLSKEHDVAKETVQNGRDADIAAKAALASHKRDAGRRLRAREAEVTLTRKRAATANKLRDLKVRGALAEDDRGHFSSKGEAALAAAEAAAEAVARAEVGLYFTKTADAEKLADLVAAENKAATNINQRVRVTASVAERLVVRELSAAQAKRARAAADAAVEAAREELALLVARADGPLTQTSADAETCAEKSRRAAAEARRQAAEEELPLRHDAEAEEVVVQNLEGAEVKLRDGLAGAQHSAAEAEADADAALDEQNAAAAAAAEVAATPGPAHCDILILAEARARLEDRQGDVVQCKSVKEEAERSLATARKELEEERAKPALDEFHEPEVMADEPAGPADADLKMASVLSLSASQVVSHSCKHRRSSSAASRVSTVGRMAAFEAAVDEGDITLHLALADFVAAEALVVAAKEELAALEAAAASAEEAAAAAKAKLDACPDGRVPATTPWATASLIREEKGIIDARLANHADISGGLTGAYEKAEAQWKEEKEKLKAELHRADMHLKQVTEDAEHQQELRKACQIKGQSP